jgi:hypothetical protein
MSNEEDLSSVKMCVQKQTLSDRNFIDLIGNEPDKTMTNLKLRAAYLLSRIWPQKSVIKIGFLNNNDVSRTDDYVFGDKLDPIAQDIKNLDSKNSVIKVLKERIEPIVNLKFIIVDDPKEANVRITFNKNEGAWSYLGKENLNYTNPEEATMNFGWIDAPTLIHEFGHMLGLVHEHSTSFENPIQWNESAVYEWASRTQKWDKETTYSNIIEQYSITLLNGTVFDPLSIMLYFFPARLTINGVGTKENSRLSGYDVKVINEMYKDGAPETAEDFYYRVYNKTLSEAINESTEARKKFKQEKVEGFRNIHNNININKEKFGCNNNCCNKNYENNCDNFLIIFLIIFFVLIIFFFYNK